MDARDWKSIELLGYTHYSKKGYKILIQLVGNSGYDFVAEKDGEFIRVNVKMAGLKRKNNPNSWCIALSGATDVYNKPKLNPVDIYLAWIENQQRFIELPNTFFDGYKTKQVRIPKEILET